MMIKPIPTGAHGRKTRYHIQIEDGESIAYFDTLEATGLVLRYLTGATMNEADYEAARAAMKEFDGKEVKK